MPKPDYVLYFRAHRDGEGEGERDAILAPNFSRTILQRLAQAEDCGLKESLIPSVFLNFRKQGGSDKVYPWLIVEHKKQDASPGYGWCQAANAALRAIKMYRNLAKYAKQRPNESHVPPIVTMTTVGSRFRVWIAYCPGTGDFCVSSPETSVAKTLEALSSDS
jgi:hypothetical protein